MKRIVIATTILIATVAALATWWFGAMSANETVSVVQDASPDSSIDSMYSRMTGKEFDRAYLADMIMHHQGALNMASYARTQTTKDEIRTLSTAILASQTTEVRQMLDWQQQWGYVDGSDPHAGHAMEADDGMGASMAAMEAKLYDLTGDAYDKEFLAQMIAHHQQAVDMSKYAETNASHQEIKELARNIIRVQEKEIADMRRWQQEWQR